MKLNPDCIYALERCSTLVISSGPPFRRMIPCSRKVKASWVAMWRYTPLRQSGRSLIFAGTQAVSWREQEPGTLLHKCERYDFWLSILKDTIELATEDACGKDLDVIILRTNIRKLAEIVDKDLYVKLLSGMRVASEIKDLLSLGSNTTGKINRKR